MQADIDKILITEKDIQDKVLQLGEAISRDYEGKYPLLIGVLKGATVFMSDLARSIRIPLELNYISISSYGSSAETSGEVRLVKDLDEAVEDRHVLIVEDIVDTGLTLSYLIRNISARRPKSVKVCALLDKPSRRIQEVQIDYKGFEIPDKFVVGYGLDYAQKYRNLPYICTLK